MIFISGMEPKPSSTVVSQVSAKPSLTWKICSHKYCNYTLCAVAVVSEREYCCKFCVRRLFHPPGGNTPESDIHCLHKLHKYLLIKIYSKQKCLLPRFEQQTSCNKNNKNVVIGIWTTILLDMSKIPNQLSYISNKTQTLRYVYKYTYVVHAL